MSDVTLLRTLTRKSPMKFGAIPSKTVSDMLISDPYQLIRAYYNLSAISFSDDVLDELGITPELRITKPGKSEYNAGGDLIRAANANRKAMLPEPTELQRLADAARRKGYRRNWALLSRAGNPSAARNQSYNHGRG
jgi:hypothetical protein